ncbi:FBD-associated F-box protein [Striga hermonthica]|uniref:FBD-associated F-box protein n=1 Tax=Striga hermonthica TaxID=68872 RepID=A0A9N7NX59_STRHE|nr:FBD-associated F-box protein [Striga hermonthica]
MEEIRQQPSGKCPTLSDAEQNMASIDRLSSLSDEVISHILSFLPIKRSVAISILGKRWRFLWALLPSLHFSHEAKRMETLTLDCVKCNEYQLETWITTTVERGIRNLYLKLDFNTFPQSLFNCKTIVKLKLDNNSAPLSALENVSLPSLKKFYVSNLICENDDALPRFLSRCPSLEVLNMVFTSYYDYVSYINISSTTIKTLKLDLVRLICPWKREYRIIINAPTLRYLQVYGYALQGITIPITKISLVEADIRLNDYSFLNLKMSCNSTLVRFLNSLCYVKCLKISGWEFEEFVHRGVSCSTVKFDNLTKLELQWNFKWSLLVKFLEVADNLQVLTVHSKMGSLWTEPKQAPKCLLSCLRTITVKFMWFKEHECDMQGPESPDAWYRFMSGREWRAPTAVSRSVMGCFRSVLPVDGESVDRRVPFSPKIHFPHRCLYSFPFISSTPANFQLVSIGIATVSLFRLQVSLLPFSTS